MYIAVQDTVIIPNIFPNDSANHYKTFISGDLCSIYKVGALALLIIVFSQFS